MEVAQICAAADAPPEGQGEDAAPVVPAQAGRQVGHGWRDTPRQDQPRQTELGGRNAVPEVAAKGQVPVRHVAEQVVSIDDDDNRNPPRIAPTPFAHERTVFVIGPSFLVVKQSPAQQPPWMVMSTHYWRQPLRVREHLRESSASIAPSGIGHRVHLGPYCITTLSVCSLLRIAWGHQFKMSLATLTRQGRCASSRASATAARRRGGAPMFAVATPELAVFVALR